MLNALLLILEPMVTWEKIHRAGRGMVFVLLLYLLPLVLLTSVAEGYGLVRFGKKRGEVMEVSQRKLFTRGEVVIFETAQVLLSLVVVFVSANMLKSIGETFHGRHTYTQAFIAMAYGLSPLFLLRMLDALAFVNPWVTWSVGVLLSIKVLYHGVPRMMEPDPPHAFGLFLMSALVVVLITGMVRFVTWWYLIGRLGKLDALISDLIARVRL
jgi:hypothetical protein